MHQRSLSSPDIIGSDAHHTSDADATTDDCETFSIGDEVDLESERKNAQNRNGKGRANSAGSARVGSSSVRWKSEGRARVTNRFAKTIPLLVQNIPTLLPALPGTNKVPSTLPPPLLKSGLLLPSSMLLESDSATKKKKKISSTTHREVLMREVRKKLREEQATRKQPFEKEDRYALQVFDSEYKKRSSAFAKPFSYTAALHPEDTILLRWRSAVINDSVTPEARAHHTQSRIGSALYIYGGQNSQGEPMGDLWVLDTEALSWQQPRVTGDPPPPLCHHAAAALGQCVYIIGGWDGKRRRNDVWRLNTHTMEWTRLEIGGAPADILPPHSSHTATVVGDNKIVVVGRQSGQRRWSDVHMLNLQTMKWTIGSSQVSSRSGHTANVVRDLVYIFGGRRSSEIDIVRPTNLTSSKFTFAAKAGPVGRSYHSCTTIGDPTKYAEMLIYGGVVEGRTVLDEFLVLETRHMRWYKPPIQGSTVPLYAHSATLVGERLFIFGGKTGSNRCSDALFVVSIERGDPKDMILRAVQHATGTASPESVNEAN